jgi:hypothetical protein
LIFSESSLFRVGKPVEHFLGNWAELYAAVGTLILSWPAIQ